METLKWFFQLIGEEADIKTIFELFLDRAEFASIEGASFLLFQQPAESGASTARAEAEAVLAKLNAAAQVAYGNHENIRLGGMACEDTPGGPLHQFLEPSSIRSSCRVGGAKVLTDRLLTAAERDEQFERALYLFGVLPQDWRGLYVVLDAAKEGTGGMEALKAKCWVKAALVDNFKRTANNFRAIGSQARHGTLHDPESKPSQTLEDARDMVRTILERWGKELAG